MSIVQLSQVSLAFPKKTCFTDFSTQVQWGQRIAIVGNNGVGKSSLLKLLLGELKPSEGEIVISPDIGIGYVKQIQDTPHSENLSGGQRVNQALNQALIPSNELLLLDEPTNHLDRDNRRTFLRMLSNYYGTIILVTHDDELMDQICDTIWHIENKQITVFSGCYSDFLKQRDAEMEKLEIRVDQLKQAQRDAHDDLMREQQRAAHARQRGAVSIDQRKWPTVKSVTKLARGNTTAGSKQLEIRTERQKVARQLAELPRTEKIAPRFYLSHSNSSATHIVQINNGVVGYHKPIVTGVNLSLACGERWALRGKNGCGKSTLARAILNDPAVQRSGYWNLPKNIAYIDQHYANLNSNLSVLESIADYSPDWSHTEQRRHLSDFLFKGDDAIHAKVHHLSGGEKARLSLACVAAQVPQLLILDEITNNLDRTTRQHMIEVLRNYPGTLLLISHDEKFLEQVGNVQFHRVVNQ